MQNTRGHPFDSLVAPHLETLYRVAYRLVRNSADAQDLVQDTCVAACSSLDALAAAEFPLRWLLRVQHNRFVDAHRRGRRSPLTAVTEPEDIEVMTSDLPGPEQLMQQFQSEALLERAFLQLEEVPRMLLSLRAEGYELPEIELITGIDRGALSARLHRARLRLAHHVAALQREAETVRQLGGIK